MRLLATLLTATLVLTGSVAVADQCQLVSIDVADRAYGSIRAARGRVLHYCAPCGDALPPVTAASVPREVRSTSESVYIDGREVDLAYVYLEVSPGLFENVGIRTGCDVLLNLDGGGSTTLVLQDPATGEHQVVNVPVGRGAKGSLRLVANSVGLRVRTPPTKP